MRRVRVWRAASSSGPAGRLRGCAGSGVVSGVGIQARGRPVIGPVPTLPVVIVAAALGLAVGSFLNVAVYRVPRGESVSYPASHCPSCQTPLKRRHNVPVLSWLLLRGRCAFCHGRISPRYPIVEAATGALFAAIAAGYWPCAVLAVVAGLWLLAVIVIRRSEQRAR